MAAKPLDLDTAPRAELVAKIKNLRAEVAALAQVNRRGLEELVRLDARERHVNKTLKDLLRPWS